MGTGPVRAAPLRRHLCAALLAAPLLLPARQAAADGSLHRVAREGRLTVALGVSMAVLPAVPDAPVTLADPFNAAVAELIAAALGLPARVVSGGWTPGATELLLAGEADIALAPLLSRYGPRRIAFAVPHVQIDIVLVAPAGGPAQQPGRLRGRRIGMPLGYAQAIESRGRNPLAQAEIVAYGHLAELEAALATGGVEFAAVARHQARAILARNPGFVERMTVAPQSFAAAVRHGEHDLLNAVDLAIEDGLRRGTIRALFERHVGLPWTPPREA